MKDKGTFGLAVIALIFGVFTLWRGRASWYSMVQVTGAQAQTVALLSIAFSLSLFWLYFRASKKR